MKKKIIVFSMILAVTAASIFLLHNSNAHQFYLSYNLHDNMVKLNWTDHNRSCYGYIIERRNIKDTQYTFLNRVPAEITSYSDTPELKQKTWIYRVSPLLKNGEKAYSNAAIISTISKEVIPHKVSRVKASSSYSDMVAINWDYSVNKVMPVGYIVERRVKLKPYEEVGFVEYGSNAFLDNNVQEKTKYYYRIKTVSSNSYSPYSKEVSIKTKDMTLLPNSVRNVRLNKYSNSLKISWDYGNSSTVSHFNIYKREGDKGFQKVSSVPYGKNQYIDKEIRANKTYCYYITASKYDIESKPSEKVKTVFSKIALGDIEEFNVIFNKQVVQVNWNVSHNKAYLIKLYRKRGKGNWELLDLFDFNVTHYTDSSVIHGDIYKYRIIAYNWKSQKEKISTEIRIKSMQINKPTDCTVKASSDHEITINWKDNSNNENGFIIERSTNKIFYKPIASVSANQTLYKDYKLKADTEYYYKVKAF